MKQVRRLGVLAVVGGCLLSTGFGSPALGDDVERPAHIYVLLAGGPSIVDARATFEDTDIGAGTGTLVDYQTEFGGGLGLVAGYDAGKVMVEAEFSFAYNELNKVYETTDGVRVFVPNEQVTGDTDPQFVTRVLGVNAWLLPFDGAADAHPVLQSFYLGGGVGRLTSEFDIEDPDGRYDYETGRVRRERVGDQSGLSAQWGAGLRFHSDDVMFDVGYRSVSASSGGTTDRVVDRHMVTLSLGFFF